MIVFGMLVIGVLVVGLVVALMLRSVTLGEARTEKEMHAPGAHTVAYDVPNGMDAAVFMSALSSAGYQAVSDMQGGVERLLIACPEPGDRDGVRQVIEHVHKGGFEGPEVHLEHVTFEDER
jgi:hypothetical protein